MSPQSRPAKGSISLGQSIAAVSEQNSAAAQEVSAGAEKMSAQAEEVVASAEILAAEAAQLDGLAAGFTLERSRAAGAKVVGLNPRKAA